MKSVRTPKKEIVMTIDTNKLTMSLLYSMTSVFILWSKHSLLLLLLLVLLLLLQKVLIV